MHSNLSPVNPTAKSHFLSFLLISFC